MEPSIRGLLFLLAGIIVGLILIWLDRRFGNSPRVAYCDICGAALKESGWRVSLYNPHTGLPQRWTRDIYCYGASGMEKHYYVMQSTRSDPYRAAELAEGYSKKRGEK